VILRRNMKGRPLRPRIPAVVLPSQAPRTALNLLRRPTAAPGVSIGFPSINSILARGPSPAFQRVSSALKVRSGYDRPGRFIEAIRARPKKGFGTILTDFRSRMDAARQIPSAATTLSTANEPGLPSGIGTNENPFMLPEEVVLPGGIALPTWALAVVGVLLVLFLVRR
jgi:hypothetical protein